MLAQKRCKGKEFLQTTREGSQAKVLSTNSILTVFVVFVLCREDYTLLRVCIASERSNVHVWGVIFG